jgi:hypothetical protein
MMITRDKLDCCARPPNFACYSNSPLGTGPRDNLAFSAEQALLAGDHGSPPRAQQHRDAQQKKGSRCGGGGGDDRPGEAESRRAPGKQHHRPDNEGDHPGKADHPERSDVSLGNQQADTEQHEPHPRVVDRKQIERIQRHQQADAANNSGSVRPSILRRRSGTSSAMTSMT